MARYWFRQKRYGLGATPNTWQGWVLVLVGVALLVAGVVINGKDPQEVWLGSLLIFAGVVPVSIIVWFKTEGGWRWRWGDDD